MLSRRSLLAGLGAAFFFPALGEAKEPGPIGRLRAWHITKLEPLEGGVISIGKGWNRGNLAVTFRNRFGLLRRGRMPTQEFLRLALGRPITTEALVAFTDVRRIADFSQGKVPVLGRDIRAAFAAPAWTMPLQHPEYPEHVGNKRMPLFGDLDGQLRDGNRGVFASRGYVEGHQNDQFGGRDPGTHPAQLRHPHGEYDPDRRDFV